MIVNSYKDLAIVMTELNRICKDYNITDPNMFIFNMWNSPYIVKPKSLLSVWILREYKNKI